MFYKRINDKSLWAIFCLLIFTIFADVYGLYTFYLDISNILAFNVFLIIETSLLYYFFFQLFLTRLIKQLLIFLFCFFLLFWTVEFFNYGTKQFLFYGAIFENITVLAFIIYFYYEQLIKFNSTLIYYQSRFWVVSAYLVYIAGTFFLLLFMTSLNSKDQVKYYVLNYVFVIIRTILLSIAMFVRNNEGKNKFKIT